jgi:hypothetical protein
MDVNTVDMELLRAWDAPPLPTHSADLDTYALRELMERVSAAANWFEDHDVWLEQLAERGAVAEIREWAHSTIWETVARETGPEDEVAEYAGRVRDAMLDLADAMEEDLDERARDRDR